jgi:hypothetical protein
MGEAEGEETTAEQRESLRLSCSIKRSHVRQHRICMRSTQSTGHEANLHGEGPVAPGPVYQLSWWRWLHSMPQQF